MKQKLIFIFAIIILIGLSIWYFDPFHKPVEKMTELIGESYSNITNTGFSSKPDFSTSFNKNKSLNEFQGGILSSNAVLKDSIIRQYTWNLINHKVTIWVTKTEKSDNEIIDAIRYKNNVKF